MYRHELPIAVWVCSVSARARSSAVKLVSSSRRLRAGIDRRTQTTTSSMGSGARLGRIANPHDSSRVR